MAIVTLPSALRFAREVSWSLDRPAQINRSGYSGQRSVVANPWHGRWSAKIELAPIIGETAMLQWRAFLGSLQGAVNSFRLPATEGPQNSNTGVTIYANQAAGDNVIVLSGITELMRSGQFITVNDQLLLCVTAFPMGTGATQGVYVEPPLRAAAPAGTGVLCRRPTALVSLKDSVVGWSVGPGQIYGATLEVEEVYSAVVAYPTELPELPAIARGVASGLATVSGVSTTASLGTTLGAASGAASVAGIGGARVAATGSAAGVATVGGISGSAATLDSSITPPDFWLTSLSTYPPELNIKFNDTIYTTWER